jgi:hypothetical protein
LGTIRCKAASGLVIARRKHTEYGSRDDIEVDGRSRIDASADGSGKRGAVGAD